MPQSGFVAVDEGTLYYEITGEGEPLIFVHGHSLDSRMWREQVAYFSDRYRVVTYDARGYGRSSKQREDLRFTHCDDLVALMDALPVLGAGLALVPWALVELILGHYGRALGIAGLFAVILSVRNTLEPQLVGKQIGLHPLAALLSFFAGWRLAGLPGMLLGPILALILVKLQEWGYSRLWR